MIKTFIYLRHWLQTLGVNPNSIHVYILIPDNIDCDKVKRQIANEGFKKESEDIASICGIKIDVF